MINVYLFRTSSFPSTQLDEIIRLANAYQGPLHFIFGDHVFEDCSDDFDANDLFHQMQNVRKKLKIKKDAFASVYGMNRLNNNYFSMGDGKKNYYIHHKSWNVLSNIDSIYPNVYILYSNILKEHVYSDFKLLMKSVHYETRGCYMDFCQNKSDILFQLRTADTCEHCIKDISHAQLDDSVSQYINFFI
jgi:hypothetical protein